MNAKDRKDRKAFGIELLIYAALVAGYFYAVLHLLGGWLQQLYDGDKLWYAVVSLALVAGQGVILETLTTGLLKYVRGKLH